MKSIIFVIGLFLISCKSVKLNGNFCKNDVESGHTCVSLKDNIYELEIIEGLYHGVSIGTWQKKKSKIILNSFLKSGIIKTREENWNTDGITVKIVDTSGVPIYFKEIIINFDNSETQVYKINPDTYNGQIHFNGSKKVKGINVKISEEELYTSHIQNINANYFEIVIQPKDNSYIYFKDEELKIINKNKIYYYRKINEKIYLQKLRKKNM